MWGIFIYVLWLIVNYIENYLDIYRDKYDYGGKFYNYFSFLFLYI